MRNLSNLRLSVALFLVGAFSKSYDNSLTVEGFFRQSCYNFNSRASWPSA